MVVLDDLFCDLSIRQREVAGDFSFCDLVEAVDKDRFEALLSGRARDVGVELDLKRPPAPIARAAKTVDPDADSDPVFDADADADVDADPKHERG